MFSFDIKNCLSLILCLLIGVSSSTFVFAQSEKPIYKFYNVFGNNFNAIEASIKKNRPDGNNSGNEWHISWQYSFEEKKDRCYISEPVVNRKVVIILPQWRPESGASSALIKEWQRYSQALKVHQLGHVAYAKKAQKAILTALEHMPPNKSCAILKKEANALAKTILEDFYAQDRQYEKSTKKGLEQGAVFKEP